MTLMAKVLYSPKACRENHAFIFPHHSTTRFTVKNIRLFSFILFTLFSFITYAEKNPVVEFKTNMGDLHIELYPKEAPITVKNFLEYVGNGFYNGTVFHRTIPNFMIQGGGFTSDLTKKPTQAPIKNESEKTPPNSRGTIAMARTNVPDSATAQFFINVVDNPYLNHKPGRPGYAVFGKVIKGMDIADKIANGATKRKGMMANLPVEEVVIQSATLLSAKKAEKK